MSATSSPHRAEQIMDFPDYAQRLEADLRAALRGEVRFDPGSRAAYSRDASNYRQIPIGVIAPKSVDDVIAAVRLCRQHGAPITSRGGGTSLAGQCCNVAIVIDWSKYLHHVLEIDPDRGIARIEPGCNLDTLRQQAEEKYGLTFGPDPSTHNRNTLGGMLGNNSCGVHSVMAALYGPGPLTAHNTESLEILTYDGQRMTVGPTSEDELNEIIAAGGRRGEIYRHLRNLRDEYARQIREKYPDIPRRVSGYNLNELLPENGFNVARALVGSEGTCVTILEATVKLIPRHPVRSLLVLGYPSVYEAADHVCEIMEYKPVGLEGLDDKLIGYMKQEGLHPEDVQLLPDGNGWLLVEFGGDTKEQSDQQARKLMGALRQRDNAPSMKLFDNPWEEQKLWEVRESGLGATAHVPNMPDAYPGWEDAAVPPEKMGRYLRDFRQLLSEFKYDCALYGHFGQGCIHCRITFDLKTAQGIRHFREFLDRAADLVIGYGGSLSGEHGDGQARAALLPKMYGAELVAAFGKFKAIWDPQAKMNPGKIVDPYQPDQNLHLDPAHYHPATVDTFFRYPDDTGSFAQAVGRCVGVGKCRRSEGGTMCPSYMVTREEEDSTRGRARLLFEMLQGDVIVDGWRDKHIRESLDLCLACKGCKHECPVNVDMATYKAEFLAHYYAGRLRPRTAYAMGWIYWWARLASPVAGLVNFFTQHRPFSTLFKWLGGIAQERNVPTFASPTFVKWFKGRHPPATRAATPLSSPPRAPRPKLTHAEVPRFQTDTYDGSPRNLRLNYSAALGHFASRRVLLWPDTFSNYLLPQPAMAAVEVLERLDYRVEIPGRPLCCGRPLYDWGMLKAAKKLWREILDELAEAIDAGIPLVGLEPSCVAAFRDELINLFPGEGRARRLSEQTYLLSEFLERESFEPPPLHRRALVHGHCHHKAIMHMDAEVALLKKLELDYELLDSGCCGMAGAFGFERGHYELSIKAGERVLLPAVRNAKPDTLIIANGFSCREQIGQCTGRHALHIAEVVRMAMNQTKEETSGATVQNGF